MTGNILIQFFLTLVLAMALWRVVILGGVTGTGEQLAIPGPAEVQKALATAGMNPKNSFAFSASIAASQPDVAEAVLRKTLLDYPNHARSLMLLGSIWSEKGEKQKGQGAIELASRLAPADPWVLRRLGDYWARERQLDKAIEYWSWAMIAEPPSQKELFPILLQLADIPEARSIFERFTDQPPAWWPGFFSTLASRAVNDETVGQLYNMRKRSSRNPLTENERKTYLNRLMREERIAEAYLEWANGLGNDELRVLGLVYNGGFELPITNSGFDWRISPPGKVRIQAERTTGAEGEKALHLVFRGYEQRFGHVSQPLYLDPGQFQLRGKVLVDKLKTLGGLQWSVLCTGKETDPRKALLGESERFLGSTEWHDFSLDFLVPETCSGQQLLLKAVGRDAIDWEMNGDIWFDAISIRRRKERE